MHAPKTGAMGLPRPHKPRKQTGEMSKPGQGPGEPYIPPATKNFVRGLTRQIKLPRRRS